ncbi:MAG: HdeD family acid-resistance protein [Hyphomicrobiaceae bacterium]|nr:HdeD family acid-resistance protein [Hyphomicrobiaceae bacterium]
MSEATIPAAGRQMPHDLAERIASKRTEIFWIGVAMVIVGILALLFPVFTTFTVELMIGWVLVLAGLVTAYGAFSVEGTGPFFGELLLGLLKLGLGVYLLTHPGVGMIAITLLLATVFMVDGAVQLRFAFDMGRRGGWFWVLLSGLVSIAAGLLIAAGLPETSLFIMGLLVGINFLSTGIAFIVLSQQSVPGRAGAEPVRTGTSTA